MNRLCLIGLGVVATVLVAWFIVLPIFDTVSQHLSNEDIQVDITLTAKSETGGSEFKANYHWGATQTESELEWLSESSNANVHTNNELTSLLQEYFSAITILQDTFSINSDGTWSLHLVQMVYDGITLGLNILGDDSDVNEINPYLQASAPVELTLALEALGIQNLEVLGRIDIHVKGVFLEDFYENFFDRALEFGSFVSGTYDGVIGLIPV